MTQYAKPQRKLKMKIFRHIFPFSLPRIYSSILSIGFVLLGQNAFAQQPGECITTGAVTSCYFSGKPSWIDQHNPESLGGPHARLFWSKEDACTSALIRMGGSPALMTLRPVAGDYWFYCSDGSHTSLVLGGIACPIFPDEIDSETGEWNKNTGRYVPGVNPAPSPPKWPVAVWGGGGFSGFCAVKNRAISTSPLSCQGKYGNPIDAFFGLKLQTETDYAASGKSALKWQRVYRTSVFTSAIPGQIGVHWWHSGSWSIRQTGVSAIVNTDEGSEIQFTSSSAGWIASSLSQSASLVELFNAQGARSGWRLKLADNRLIEFDQDGRVVFLTHATGSRFSFIYTDGTLNPPFGSRLVNASGALIQPAIAAPRGKLLRIEDQFGQSIELAYSALGQIALIKTPTGEQIRYEYLQDQRLDAVFFPQGTPGRLLGEVKRKFHYEHSNYSSLLTGMTDEKGVRYASFDYTATGFARETKHMINGVEVEKYNISAEPWVDGTASRTVTNPLGSQSLLQIRSIGGEARLVSQSQPAGAGCGPASSSISYDAQANVSSRTDFNNTKTCYSYDLSRNLETRRIEGLPGAAACAASFSNPPADARLITTQWHPDWRLETRRAEPGLITTSVYNGQGASCAPADALVDGKPIAVVCRRTEQATTDETGASGFAAAVSGPARTTSFTYNRWGQVLTSNGPRGDASDTLTYSYYPDTQANWTQGDLRQISNGLGHITRFTRYNRHGQVLERVEPNGLVTQYSYDLRQRLTRVQAGDEVSTYEYDAVGNLTQATLPEGGVVTYTYDPAHRLVAIQDPQGNRIDYTLDAMGNRIAEKTTDAAGVLRGNVTRTMDALNRVQKVVGGE